MQATAFMREFGLRVPILLAPINAPATNDLIRAVGQAGGMGSIGLTGQPQAAALARIAEVRAMGVPFFVNFILHFGTEGIVAAAEAGPTAVTLSFGVEAGLVRQIKAHGVAVGIQVGSLAGVQVALQAGADFLIAQGMEAGGHVQSTTPLGGYLAAAVQAAGKVPVVAAGGIADAGAMADALRQGAQAVVMGTRYLATRESAAHPHYKQALVQAGAADTVLTNCFDGGWPYAMHRVLRNSTFAAWEAAGCPQAPNRPGEGDSVLLVDDVPVLRYADTSPVQTAVGDPLAACLYAGTGVGSVAAVEPAAALTLRLWAECQALLAGT